MKDLLYLDKRIGETPLETIKRFRKENLEYEKVKMTYAGRLDPMAEGVLIVLVGEECKNKENYLGMDKEYEFEILWGFQTDTYDILGLPQKRGLDPLFDKKVFKGLLDGLKGKQKQKYPPYSSMTVKGKQLHQWAREGRLDEIDIPEQEIEIYDIDLLGSEEINKQEVEKNILERINLVHGDFRQEGIKIQWQKILKLSVAELLTISKVRIKCSSGTYVRGIVNELGKQMKIGAVTYSINRTRIY